MREFKKTSLLGVGFTYASKSEVLEFIITGLQGNIKKYYIVTPNPELLVIASDNRDYKDILNNAKLALIDGIGVLIGAKIVGKVMGQRITGVDLVESLCNRISNQPITVGFLGGGPFIAEKTSECLKIKYPGLKVGLVSKEWENSLLNKKIDILFVAFGSPKQENWIATNLEKIPAKVVIGVGGSFDFISGNVKRAPRVLRDLGLEWLFRLIIQPWRIKRQISLIKFVYLIFKEKFFS